MLKDEFCTLEASRCIILRGRNNSGRLLVARGGAQTASFHPQLAPSQTGIFRATNDLSSYTRAEVAAQSIILHRTPPPRAMILRPIAFPTRRKEKLCRQAGRHSFSTKFSLEGEISLVPRTIFLFLTPRTILFIGEDFELVCIP